MGLPDHARCFFWLRCALAVSRPIYRRRRLGDRPPAPGAPGGPAARLLASRVRQCSPSLSLK